MRSAPLAAPHSTRPCVAAAEAEALSPSTMPCLCKDYQDKVMHSLWTMHCLCKAH